MSSRGHIQTGTGRTVLSLREVAERAKGKITSPNKATDIKKAKTTLQSEAGRNGLSGHEGVGKLLALNPDVDADRRQFFKWLGELAAGILILSPATSS